MKSFRFFFFVFGDIWTNLRTQLKNGSNLNQIMSRSMSEKHDIPNLWYFVSLKWVCLEIWDIALYNLYNFVMKHFKKKMIHYVRWTSDQIMWLRICKQPITSGTKSMFKDRSDYMFCKPQLYTEMCICISTGNKCCERNVNVHWAVGPVHWWRMSSGGGQWLCND